MAASFFLAAALVLAAPQSGGQPLAAPNTAPAAATLASIPSDTEIEAFLKDADVVKAKDTKKGVTGSLRATLSDGKMTHDAQIQTIDESKREFRTERGVEFDFRDSWHYNIAAYKLDRMIGLNMAPVSITRTHRSTPGAWTWWLDDVLMDEGEKQKKKIEPPDRPAWSRQWALMYVFDELIANTDRNQGNILYTTDWRVWLIDHTRAFRKNTSLKNPARITRCDRQVFERLKALDLQTLKKELGQDLEEGQIKAMLARRDAIVKKLESLGSTALFDRTPSS
jgi:hypothetical protein